MRPLILVAADDAQLRATLARWLMAAGYSVELAESAKRAREVAAAQPVALAIIDSRAFGDAAAELARELAAATGGLLTIEEKSANATAEPAGPEGPILKPLEQESVLARVRAALPAPASEPAPVDRGVVRFEGYTLDAGARTCVAPDGRDVGLTRAEFTLLLCLIEHAGRVVSRDRLSLAVAGRPAGPDDRNIDVLVSRVRRKIESDPKEPRLIITVLGDGYRFAARAQTVAIEMPTEASAPASAVAPDMPTAAAAVPVGQAVTAAPPRRRFGSLAMIGSVGAVLAAAVLAIVLWLPRGGTPGQAPIEPPRKFDAAVVPFVNDARRRELASYPTQSDYKALALAIDGWHAVYGAPTQEAAKAQAIEQCVRVSKRPCSIYSVGMDVIWPRNSPPMPLRADFHATPLDLPFVAAQLVPLDAQTRKTLVGEYVSVRDHKGLAVSSTGQHWVSFNHINPTEVARVTVEKCGAAFGTPCLLVSIDDKLTIEIPKSRQIVGFFMVTIEPGLSDAERAMIDQAYQGKDWRALARGAGGGWYPVADAVSEQAAVEGALASCAQHDSGCRLYAIGNFRVGDAPPSAGDTMVLSAKSEPAPEHPFDAAKVPLVFDAVRRELAAYPQRADFKAVAISTDGWGIAFGAADRASAEHGALAQCLTRSKLDKSCRLYAEGMNVVWTDKSLRLPMSADIHESLGLPFSLDALPFAVDVDALRIKNVLALTNHSAYAIKSVRPIAGLTAGGYANPSEATRIVIERCSDYYHAPCLLLTVDGNLTVQVPKTRKVTNVFMLATETQMSTADKQRTAEIYGQKDWRALARGANGGWYPVANAPSEAAAIEAAMAACAQQDSGCHLYAISNFHVDDQ